MMKVTEVAPEYVYNRINAGSIVDVVDYKKKEYIELTGRTIGELNFLLSRAKTDKDVKFFQLDNE